MIQIGNIKINKDYIQVLITVDSRKTTDFLIVKEQNRLKLMEPVDELFDSGTYYNDIEQVKKYLSHKYSGRYYIKDNTVYVKPKISILLKTNQVIDIYLDKLPEITHEDYIEADVIDIKIYDGEYYRYNS